MKFGTILLSVCCCLVCLVSGCNNNSYAVYTNMPDGSFEITQKKYKLGGLIEGYESLSGNYDNKDTSVYSSMHESFYSMTAKADLVVSDDFSSDEAKAKCNTFFQVVSAKLYVIEKSISATVKNSDIYNFNEAAQGARIEISKTGYEVLSEAKYVFELTNGYYNPALYYNVEAYGFAGDNEKPTSKAELPKDETIAKYTELSSHFNELKLEYDEAESKYFVTKPSCTVEVDGETLTMKLDLGGIGKGYAVDCVDELFDEYGYEYGYFSFATSSMLVKNQYKTGEYNLSFTDPRTPNGTYLTTTVRNEKLSTSGDNEQRYIIDGTRYCHIISAKTGKPVQTGIMSATVIGGSAAQDDALTTAIMAMEKNEAVEFIRNKLTDKRVVFTFE